MTSGSPKVFISYSHDSHEHRERVLALSNRLRNEGIDCVIDQDYEVSPPPNLPQWMQDQIEDAEFVLLVCTETYDLRFRGKEVPGKGKGVKWEGLIITLELYNSESNKSKFIPIVFTEEDIQHIPKPLSGNIYYNPFAGDGYENLYRRLTNQPKHLQPILGKLLKLPTSATKRDFFATSRTVTPIADPFLVPRQKELAELSTHLRSPSRNEQIGIKVAVWGMSGYGKTTLAMDVCDREEILEAFPDGTLWVNLGENPEDPINLVQKLLIHLGEDGVIPSNPQNATDILRSKLGGKRFLIVVDDLREKEDLKYFLQGGPFCAHLITTPFFDTVLDLDRTVHIAAMEESDALTLLKARIEDNPDLPLFTDELKKLAERLDLMPHLLNQASNFLAEEVTFDKRSTNAVKVSNAIKALNETLNENGLLGTFEVGKAVNATVEASLKWFDDASVDRFKELAVFRKGVDIPRASVERFWAATGGIEKKSNVRNLCKRLYKFSLLRDFDPGSGVIRLHDLINEYLLKQQKDHLPELNNRLLDSYYTNPNWYTLLDDEYMQKHLTFHLIESGRVEELVTIVKDWRYLATKTRLRNSLDVETDLREAVARPPNDELRRLQRAFVNSSRWLEGAAEDEIEARLYARLQHLRGCVTAMPQDSDVEFTAPYIAVRSDFPDLQSPLETNLLKGNPNSVKSCNFNYDRSRMVTALYGGTLKVWDTQTCELLAPSLEGHPKPVNGCAFSPDGSRVVSASSDHTLKVWDLKQGKALPLEGHLASVNGCTFSPDGSRIVSASSDHTLIIWDAQEGRMLHTLKRDAKWEWNDELEREEEVEVWIDGHEGAVNDCAFSSDGKWIVSASDDETLKVWDVESNKPKHTLEHSGAVTRCAFSQDGKYLVSASSDGKLRVWDAQEWKFYRQLPSALDSSSGRYVEKDARNDGHEEVVNGCAFSPDGRLVVSASSDGTFKVWEVSSGRCIATFYDEGRMYCCLTDDEMIFGGGTRGVYFLRLVGQDLL